MSSRVSVVVEISLVEDSKHSQTKVGMEDGSGMKWQQ